MSKGMIKAAVLSVALAAASTACGSKDNSSPTLPDPSKNGRVTLNCAGAEVKVDTTGISSIKAPKTMKSAIYEKTEADGDHISADDKAIFRFESNVPGRYVQMSVRANMYVFDSTYDYEESGLGVEIEEITPETYAKKLTKKDARDRFVLPSGPGIKFDDYHESGEIAELLELVGDDLQRPHYLHTGETAKFTIKPTKYFGANELEVPCAVRADFSAY